MKRVLVEFDEQSKAVVAKVCIEYTDDNPNNIPAPLVILEETKALFEEANRYALNKTIQKSR